jgi:ParB family transcriptional regulator, chromosome partitioning protein
MDRKAQPRLGRGLDSLLNVTDTALVPRSRANTDAALLPNHTSPAGQSTKIALGLIELNPHQPRKTFEEEELQKLEDSIRTHGVLNPILVRPVGDKYQLIAGERRLRAAQRLGLTEIPANVREMDEQQVLEAALVENIQRTDLNPIEKAAGFKDYLDKFKMTHEHLAGRIGVDRTSITNLLGLLNLPPEVQEFVRVGALTLGHAKVLKGITDSARQIALAREVIAKSMSVHALEAAVKQDKDEKASAAPEKAPDEGRTAHVQSIEDELRQKLAIRVAIKLRNRDKGQIVLQFDSNDDFERVLEILRR